VTQFIYRTISFFFILQDTTLEIKHKFHPDVGWLPGDYKLELHLKHRDHDLACYIVKCSLTWLALRVST